MTKELEKALRATAKMMIHIPGYLEVITALRGPDDEDGWTTKLASTAVIRFALAGHDSPGVSNIDGSALAYTRTNMEPGHFRAHAQEAFRVLGLEWDKANIKILPISMRPVRRPKAKKTIS